jgi:hypothetical protein
MHAAPVLILIWVGFWEWACVSTTASSTRIAVWSVINCGVAMALYLRAKRMGVVPRDSRLVLRYLLFDRAVPWNEVERFSLEPLRGGLALRLYKVDGRKINVPAGQFAAAETNESWLRSHRVVWPGGETQDVLGTLNRVTDDHRRCAPA